jgi:hypothetical protein
MVEDSAKKYRTDSKRGIPNGNTSCAIQPVRWGLSAVVHAPGSLLAETGGKVSR